MTKKQLLLAYLFVIFALPTKAQQYFFTTLGLEQGMPSVHVNQVLEDSRGYFWLATEGAGLVRYDGYSFTPVQLNAELRPIISSIYEDENNNLWLGSNDRLVNYNGLNSEVYFLPNSTDRIRQLAGSKGEVYVSTEKNIYKTTGADTLSEVATGEWGRIYDILFTEAHLWVASDSGLFRAGEQLTDLRVVDLEKTNEAVIGACPQLTETSRSLGADLRLYRGKSVAAGPSNMALLQGNAARLYTKMEERELTENHGLPVKTIKDAYIDRCGVFWFYGNQGIIKLESTALQLLGEETGIMSEVFSVHLSEDGFLAGSSEGLVHYHGDTANLFSGNEFPFGLVLSIARFNGSWWLGTERGLVQYNGRSFKTPMSGAIGGDFIFSLFGTAEGLYIGSGSGLLLMQDKRLINISEQQNLPPGPVYDIRRGEDGSLWAGSYTNGFYCKAGTGWEQLEQMGGMRFDSLQFNSFAPVSAGELWAATPSEGLFHFTQGGVEHLAPQQIDFAEIRSMTYRDERLWLGTNKGLYVVTSGGGGYRVSRLGDFSQLLDEGCTPLAIHQRGNQLVAGTSNGVLLVDIDQLISRKAQPELAITDFELFYGEVPVAEEWGEGLIPYSHLLRDLSLPSNQNFLSFTLAGLTGYRPQELQYRYRVKPSADWTLAGSRREAVFANLNPGEYQFEAQVKRPGEDWRESVFYPFRINFPLWQRWWFITAMMLFLGLLIFLFVRDRIQRLNQRLRLENSLLEMERKALRLQMNPHFIFNALDSISSFIFKNDPKQAVRYLNNFAKLMRLTLESSMEHIHPVETEVSVLKNYLELEKLRFQGKFDYEIELDEDIDYDVGIPPMLIQPHVENAILHGLKPKEGHGHLAIRFVLQAELLICEIEDDGIGRKASKALPRRKDHRSMATQINKDRLALLRQSMSNEVDIQIIDKTNPTGTKVILKLPAESL